jgi:histidinol-phosphate/aromatic aminotransferase/cobyric acid decarboxylase-like protein
VTTESLARLLSGVTSGPRVAVVEPWANEYDLCLQTAGFEVICIAYSREAMDAGRHRAAALGVDMTWHLLESSLMPWPCTELDAVVVSSSCSPADDGHRWILRSAHQALIDRGPLIIVNGPRPNGLLRSTSTSSTIPTAVPEAVVDLSRVLRRAGFVVDDRDRSAVETHPGLDVLIGRTVPTPPESLAASTWAEPMDAVLLDLRYADDEADWLDPPASQVWAEFVRAIDPADGSLVERYPLDDMYGSARGAPVLATHFSCSLSADQVSFGAGVSTLLHDLAGLADDGLILAPELVHPDLEAWAFERGTHLDLVPESADGEIIRRALEARRPALVHLDRPSFSGDVMALDCVSAIAKSAEALGAVVVVDESAAGYLGPLDSAIQLVNSTRNLVVLRGFTKGYSCGGMRAAFAVASLNVCTRVRELVVPMQMSEFALEVALKLLASGDSFRRLRPRIRSAKTTFVATLRRAGFRVGTGHELIPWIVLHDPDGSVESLLTQLGIRGLRPTPPPILRPKESGLLHLTVPISARRTRLLRHILEVNHVLFAERTS